MVDSVDDNFTLIAEYIFIGMLFVLSIWYLY